ncbi:MAG TPA: PIN domain-containing protein [Candidatus Acidoferrum sp.]|nr:PIN domain-containing protein [Candidatus Acidoferrum sp.]
MSRISPEAQRRSHSPETRVSSQREDRAIHPRPGWASRVGWDFWVVRAFLFACTGAVSYTLGPFGLRGFASAGVGFLIALVVLLAELRLRRAALSGLLGGAFGAVLGVFAALLVTLVISRTDEPEPTKSFLEFAALFAFGYLGLVLGSRRGGEMHVEALDGFFGKKSTPAESLKLLDTSVLIDGRIADICDAQFLEGVLGVPQFVLHELQMVADSSDPLKRQRGRRGLEVLQRIQKMPQVEVRILEEDFPQAGDVDHKLVELARRTGAKIVTNDFNLNKVATVQGFSVLNVNLLAHALKPVVLPGEPMRVLILREGKEPNQGVAYLDDGTMVVVDGARRMINKSVDIIATSVHQTTAGKMIFGRLEERAEQAAPAMRQAAAAGRGDGSGSVRSDATSRVETSARLPEQPTLDRQARPKFPEPDAS